MFEDCYLKIGSGPIKGCLPLSAGLISSLYALPHHNETDLTELLLADGNVWPWTDSLRVAPRETARVVGASLRAVMLEVPGLEPANIDVTALAEGSRARLHLDAMLRLWRTNSAVMPADIASLRDFLGCNADDALQAVRLIAPTSSISRTRLEQTILDKLAQHHGIADADDPDFARLVSARREAAAPADRLVGHIQRGLLARTAQAMPLDDSFSVLSVRDSLGECEAAVAIIQRWLRETPEISPAEIAVIVPDGSQHAAQLAGVAQSAGLLLSGLPASASARNIGAETIYLFVQCMNAPAPAMARASLLASPIMPWPRNLGASMARRVMQGRGAITSGVDLGVDGRDLVQLLTGGGAKTNKQFSARLRVLRKLLGPSRPDIERDMAEAKRLITLLLRTLATRNEEDTPDWGALHATAGTYRLERESRGAFYSCGVSVLHSGETPRRRFEKLVVLGYNEGNYPVAAPRNAVFLDSELDEIERACGLALPTRRRMLEDGLGRFVRQLSAASDEIVLLCAERDGYGKALFPASSLALLARLVAEVKDPEDLVTSLGRAGTSVWDRLLDWRVPPEFEPQVRPQPPVHYDLGRNLLHLRLDEEGRPRPQSPSRLEKLLVSPLAWILEELDAAHVPWVPEALDVKLRGTLTHGVFERLFKAGETVCNPASIASRVPELLDECIAIDAPFMTGPAWTMERDAMIGDTIRAAEGWAAILKELDAEVVANEFWLEGEVLGHPVHGKADTLLRLGDGQPVIVDHKKSGSGKRRQRMEAGCDLQVELYRRMKVKNGKSGSETPGPEHAVLDAARGRAGVAYNMMNDSGVLVNGVAGITAPGLETFDDDISRRAMVELERRFDALRRGHLETNWSEDEKHFVRETSLGTYAFDDSPLIRAFLRPDPMPSAFAPENDDD
ncbi:hypothetical protein SKA58_16828 [Sphingomonas sp. SKA58]|uniref:PD-(D/E)XK nuclease family protein n=1 Tax=Sphingomonas sp. (strain SKA58) TaxID=314266 RepID=UPI0000D7BBBD|nr:PD-(D/E)XK nuclease family protein [Sphingomonas sp. SKA58]EAT08862.1 hypothetical protein SKA58_16828 [Sphingomonas sp. SKA58]